MARRMLLVLVGLGWAFMISGGTVFAQVTAASKSLEKCQKMAQKQTARLFKLEQRSLSGCLQKIAKNVVKDNSVTVDVTAAAATCLGQFYKIGRVDGRSLAARMATTVAAFCDPSLGTSFKGMHAADDVLGTGTPGVNQSLKVSVNNNLYCGNFAAGSTTITEWIGCLQSAASCEVRQQALVQFPRAIEWLKLMETQFAASSDTRAADAQAALQSALLAMDRNSDMLPDLACGPGLVPGIDPILPATGQTTPFVAGDDGALRLGAPLSYTDNGDGTITDNQTGLMWEKKVKLDNISDAVNLHDVDNSYPWRGSCSTAATECGTDTDCPSGESCDTGDGQTASPNGLTIFEWVAALNTANFAGYSDWRVPSINELQSIVNHDVFSPSVDVAFQGANCGPLCSDITSVACSCTFVTDHWSSTTLAGDPSNAWIVSFGFGNVNSNLKTLPRFVRAVRGGA